MMLAVMSNTKSTRSILIGVIMALDNYHLSSDVWLKDLDWSTVQLKAKTINKKIKHLDIMSNPLFKISDNKTKSHVIFKLERTRLN